MHARMQILNERRDNYNFSHDFASIRRKIDSGSIYYAIEVQYVEFRSVLRLTSYSEHVSNQSTDREGNREEKNLTRGIVKLKCFLLNV